MDLTERFVSREEKFSGRILTVHVDTVTLPDGSLATREVADHPGGVAIVALDDENNVLMVEQFRYVFNEPVLEIPAGKLEKGEDPYLAALRELKEETGATPGFFQPLGKLYPSPGCYGETLHLFLAKNLTFGEAKPDEDEFLRSERIPLEVLLQRILRNEIADAKTVAGILKAKLYLNI
ncbi:MAG: NUDIX hydrolase [Oscillospiraceae bacterium]|nr:NUDIX hydrolase [Oscillospiraceae bacterium]